MQVERSRSEVHWVRESSLVDQAFSPYLILFGGPPLLSLTATSPKATLLGIVSLSHQHLHDLRASVGL